MPTAYGDTGGWRKPRMVPAQPTGPFGPPGGIDRHPALQQPASTAPPIDWSHDPSGNVARNAGIPGLGPIPDMSGTWGYGQFGTNPPPPPPGGTPGYSVPIFMGTGTPSHTDLYGQEVAAWAATLTPEQVAAIGGPMNFSKAFWAQVVKPRIDAMMNPPKTKPWYPISNSHNYDKGGPMTGPSVINNPNAPVNNTYRDPYLEKIMGWSRGQGHGKQIGSVDYPGKPGTPVPPAAPKPPDTSPGKGGMGNFPTWAVPVGSPQRSVRGGPVGDEGPLPPGWMNSTLNGVPIHIDTPAPNRGPQNDPDSRFGGNQQGAAFSANHYQPWPQAPQAGPQLDDYTGGFKDYKGLPWKRNVRPRNRRLDQLTTFLLGY